MARYTYNAGLVTQTIDTLYAACDCLDSTNVDIQKGIDTILNARGAENINIDFSPITGYYSSVIEHIELLANELKKKAKEIEEYQDAPWYKKLFATVVMSALKLVEGLATFVENIGDGLISIAGFIGGIFSSDFKNSVAEFVRTDWVGETTAKWYDEGWLQWVDKNSYMSHESTAANILKGVGTAAGYVIVTVCTAGAGTAVSLGVSAASAAAGAIGSGTQQGLKEAQLMNPEMSAGDAFNSAFGKGVKQGVVAAGTTLIAGGIAKGLQGVKMTGNGLQFFDDVVNNADDIANLSRGARILNTAKQGITKIGNTVLNNKVGRIAIEGVQTLGGTTVGGALIKTGTQVIGASAGGQFKSNAATAEINNYIEEVNNPSIAEQLYTETQEVANNETFKPGEATEEEAKQNLQDLKEQGYDPGSGSPQPTEAPPTEATPSPTKTSAGYSGGGGGSKPTVSAPEITMPPTSAPTTPEPTPPATPVYTDPIISNINPVGPSSTGSVSTSTGVSNIVGDADVSKDIGSSEVLNTFGEAAGSLSGITGSKANIPSSSSPILSSSGGQKSSSSFVPLGAGLGAASLAGIGAKAVMDKREKSKSEESDELETEEWATQDDVEIDYGMETSTEEADYLSPTDELAFTE